MKKVIRVRTVLFCLVFANALLLGACGGSRQNDPVVTSEASLDEVVKKAIDNSILPAVDNFYAQANAFESEAETFCLAPDETGLSSLQSAWLVLARAWYHLLPYNFGPLNDDIIFPAYIFIDSYRLRGTDYTATLRNEINLNISGEHTLDVDFFGAEPFQKLGLTALELLVFEVASNQSQVGSEIVAEYLAEPRKCETLLGLTEQVQLRALYVSEGWHSSYLGSGTSYYQLFINNELEDGTEALVKLITSVQEFLDYLAARNVAVSVAQVSGESWTLVSASIDEINSLLTGLGDTRFTFYGFMLAGGHELEVNTVQENIEFARSAISQSNATDFAVASALLDGNFKREIPNSLEVVLGISFSDGD